MAAERKVALLEDCFIGGRTGDGEDPAHQSGRE